MILIQECFNLDYALKPNTGHWFHLDALPNKELISSCFGIIKYKNKICLVKHVERGVEIPGGHIESGESVMDCFHREIKEEVGLVDLTAVKLLAAQEINIQVPKPEGYKYPYPKSYQVVFFAEANTCLEFSPSLDSCGRIFVDINELKTHDFYNNYKFLFDLVF